MTKPLLFAPLAVMRDFVVRGLEACKPVARVLLVAPLALMHAFARPMVPITSVADAVAAPISAPLVAVGASDANGILFSTQFFGDRQDDASEISWADMDGDGDLDALIRNDGQPSKIYLNESGVLLDTAAWVSPANAAALAAGDVNGDGAPDLAIGNGIYLNGGLNRSGALQMRLAMTLTETPVSFAWGDMNGDGRLDLVAANLVAASKIYLNEASQTVTGSVQLREVWASAANDFVVRVALADADGDGRLDLAVGRNFRECYLRVRPDTTPDSGDVLARCGRNQIYLNRGMDDANGKLVLVSGWESADNNATADLAWGDLDGDGRPDLAVANGSAYRRGVNCEVQKDKAYQNGGLDPTTSKLVITQIFTKAACSPSRALAWGDANADGALDLAIAEDDQVNLYLNANGRLGAGNLVAKKLRVQGLAWADVNGDGSLDLTGAEGAINRLFINRSGGPAAQPGWEAPAGDFASSVAWGDADNDGDLDLAVGSILTASRVYLNDGLIAGKPELRLAWTSAIDNGEWRVAWGDADNDGRLDLAVGSEDGPPRVYLNRGMNTTRQLQLDLGWSGDTAVRTQGLAWGDADNDGRLDLAVANSGAADSSSVYRNLGLTANGTLTFSVGWMGAIGDAASSVAWGDMDGDGSLDLAIGFSNLDSNTAGKKPGIVYLNAGVGADQKLRFTPGWTAPDTEPNSTLAWGDVDGDGDLDLAEGGLTQKGQSNKNRVFLNVDGVLQNSPAWISPDSQQTHGLAWGDMDGDGDLDLAAANDNSLQVYRNHGRMLSKDSDDIWMVSDEQTSVTSIAWGDVDGNGSLDLAVGRIASNSASATWVFLSKRQSNVGLANEPTYINIAHPIVNGSVGLFGSAQVITRSVVPITYILFDRESDTAGYVLAHYSLDGGSDWRPAVATSLTDTIQLSTSPTGTQHIFMWDTFASKFFGQSKNVIFRIAVFGALPAGVVENESFRYVNGVAGGIQRAYASAQTSAFAVQGTQIRVVNGSGVPIEGAYVYRLPDGQFSDAQLMPNPASPLRTNAQGMLPGGGAVAPGDRIMAVMPATPPVAITYTEHYRYFLTSAEPYSKGLAMTMVSSPGIISLAIPTDTTGTVHPLLLFDLTISMEWDSSSDDLFMLGLEGGIKKASEMLFDATNGQAAIGQVHIFPSKSYWNRADILIYNSNSVRPSAAIGGVTRIPISETVRPSFEEVPSKTAVNAYVRGQVRLGTSWDPFGEDTSDLGEQWWRALAHELSHYLLFLPDNYIGLKLDPRANKRFMVNVDCKGSLMTTTRDPNYGEFLTLDEWAQDPACLASLAQGTTGRSDWETITAFYPFLQAPTTVFEGPTVLPLDVTRIVNWSLPESPNPLPTRNFDLRDQEGNRIRLPGAQVYLFQTQGTTELTDDVLLSIGSPTAGGDRIKVHGAARGDRLCLFDFSKANQPNIGCLEGLGGADVSLPVSPLNQQTSWPPAIDVRAITTRTLMVSVTLQSSGKTAQVLPELPLKVQIYPAHYPTLPGIAPVAVLQGSNGRYTSVLTLPFPAQDVFVRVWVDDGSTGFNTRVAGANQRRRVNSAGATPEAITRMFIQLPWSAGDSAIEVPDLPVFGGADRSPLGGADRSPLGGADRSPLGGADRSPLGGADRSPLGGADRSPLGGADRSPLGGADRSPLGGADRSPLGGADRSPLGGADRSPLGGGDKSVIGGASRRDFAAPVLSADSQIAIYDQGGLFEPGGIQALQTVPLLPELADEPWLVPVGQAYYVVPEVGIAATKTIAFNYLQRDVPEGFEHALSVYFLPQNGTTWQRLETTRFVENLVVADFQTVAGTYAVMCTVQMPDLKPGWNQFAYSLPDKRPIKDALASIANAYSVVWEQPASLVNPMLPTATKSNVTEFEFGHVYWIKITSTRNVTPYLAPPIRSPDGVIPGSR